MTKNKGLYLGAALLGALLLAGLGTEAVARTLNRLYGNSLHIENEPRTATPDVTVGDDDAYINGTLEVDGAARFDGGITGTVTVTPPAVQTIAAGGIIAADACGGIKRVTTSEPVTTDTTDTFATPAAGNAGCCMDVVYVGTSNLTLDDNANNTLPSNVILGANGSVRVCSSGASGKWYTSGTWTEF